MCSSFTEAKKNNAHARKKIDAKDLDFTATWISFRLNSLFLSIFKCEFCVFQVIVERYHKEVNLPVLDKNEIPRSTRAHNVTVRYNYQVSVFVFLSVCLRAVCMLQCANVILYKLLFCIILLIARNLAAEFWFGILMF